MEKMGSEKTQALYVPTDTYEEKSLKDKEFKCYSKYFLVWILVAILVALTVGLCVQLWFPINGHHKSENFDAVDIFDNAPLNRVELHSTAYEETTEQTTEQVSSGEKSIPWHLDFLINPTRLCETWDDPKSEAYKKNPEVKLLVLVPSATSHFTHRNTIRKTWGSVAEKPHGAVRLGFVLGTTPNATEESLIRHESEVFGDIVQGDFVDTFGNLTTKSVLMLKWVGAHCAHALYFLKTDDDTFVNMPVLASVLQKPVYDPAERFIGGYVQRGSLPGRTPAEKYYVSEEDYPELEFPPYALGSAYVTTGPTAVQLFGASQRVTPFLPLEDIFITGLCADDIDATLIHEPSFSHIRPDDSSLDSFSSLATSHSFAPSDMDYAWDQMTKAILEALNFSSDSDSSSYNSDSSDFFQSISMSDFFSWPDSDSFSGESSSSSSSWSSSSSESGKIPETKSIFDIFNLLKNQATGQGIAKYREKGLIDSGVLSKKDDGASFLSLQGNEEPIEEPAKQINRGNLLLNSEEKSKIIDAVNLQEERMIEDLLSRSNRSSSSVLSYFT